MAESFLPFLPALAALVMKALENLNYSQGDLGFSVKDKCDLRIGGGLERDGAHQSSVAWCPSIVCFPGSTTGGSQPSVSTFFVYSAQKIKS